MDWERLERWATTALYISGGAAAIIVLTRILAPDGSWPQRLAQAAVAYLTELGAVSTGLLVLIILATLMGNRIMASIFSGIDRYHEWKGKNEKIKAEAKAAGLAQGIQQGLAQGIEQGVQQGLAQGIEQGVQQGRAAERDAIRARLAELGLNPEDFLPPDQSETDDKGSRS